MKIKNIINESNKTYYDMFKNLDLDSDKKNFILQNIQWAKNILKRHDRIIWFLRVFKLRFLDNKSKESNINHFSKKAGVDKLPMLRFNNLNLIKEELEKYMAIPSIDIQNYKFEWQSSTVLLRDLAKLAEEFKKKNKDQLFPKENDTIILDYENYAWWLLPRESCWDEAKALRHCGNIELPHPGDRILSFRKKVIVADNSTWKGGLTSILHKNGFLGGTVGKNNQKPKETYYQYIIDLLKSKYVKGIWGEDARFFPEIYFIISDLPEYMMENFLKTVTNPEYFITSHDIKIIKKKYKIIPHWLQPIIEKSKQFLHQYQDDTNVENY